MAATDPKRTLGDDAISTTSNAKYLVAIIVGLAYVWLAVAFWGWYVMNHPINEILLEAFARQGHDFLYRISIFAHDVLINVLLAMPAAIALVTINGLDNWRCVFVAVITAFVGSYWTVDLASLPFLFQSWSFWAGVSMSIFSLPIAYKTAKSFRGQPEPA